MLTKGISILSKLGIQFVLIKLYVLLLNCFSGDRWSKNFQSKLFAVIFGNEIAKINMKNLKMAVYKNYGKDKSEIKSITFKFKICTCRIAFEVVIIKR